MRRQGRRSFHRRDFFSASRQDSARVIVAGEYRLYREYSTLETEMAAGTVKWFNPTKGYGFIQPSGGGGKDVFVHISAVEQAGLSTLNEGQSIEYEICDETSHSNRSEDKQLKPQHSAISSREGCWNCGSNSNTPYSSGRRIRVTYKCSHSFPEHPEFGWTD